MCRSLATFALLFLIPIVSAQSVSSTSLRQLFCLKGVEYGKTDQTLKATWPLKRDEELRAFSCSGIKPHVAANGGVILEARTGMTLREVMFRAPCQLTLRVRLLRRSSYLEIMLAGPGGEHSPLVIFLNRPIKVETSKALRQDGVLEMRFGTRKAPLGMAPAQLSHTRETRVQIDVGPEALHLTVGESPAVEVPVVLPALWSLSLRSMRGGVRLSSIGVDGAVVERSLRKLLRAGRSARRSEKGKDPSRVVMAAFMAQWMMMREERRATRKRVVIQLRKGRLGWGGPQVKKEERAALERVVRNLGRPTPEDLRMLRRLAQSHPGESYLSVMIALYEVRANHSIDAVSTLRGAVGKASKAPEASRALGILLLEQGEEREALTCFETAYKQDHGAAWTRAFLGLTLMRLGQFEKARPLVRSARGKLKGLRALKILEEQVDLLSRGPFGRTTKVVKSTHYTLESSLPKKQLVALGTRLDVYREFLERAFPLPDRKPVTSRVWLFDSREEYVAYTGTLTSRLENTGGVFHPTLNTLLLFAGMSDAYNQHVLFHEAFHQYLDQMDVRVPHWLHEGLAEYFGSTKLDATGKGIPGGVLEDRVATLKVHLGSGRPPVRLETLALMTPQEFMSPLGVSLNYAQSWSMVRFFKEHADPECRKTFALYVARILAGRGRKAAWEESFGILHEDAIASIEGAWKADLEQNLFKKLAEAEEKEQR